MPITLINIDAPDGYSDQAEWRKPRKGEPYLSCDKAVISPMTFEHESCVVLRRLQPDWTPPSFLKPGWVARDKDGEWWWFQEHPRTTSDQWFEADAAECRISSAVDTSDWPTDADGPWHKAIWEVE